MGWLLIISALTRGIIAGITGLGNDEVYYWTYALYPDWSHFDHPPMVGWFIQLFSLNLLFDSELFIRLSSVVMGTVNTWLLFRIGTFIRNERTGLFAALLYTASIYGFVIVGIFILPDTPQVFFWLVSLWLILKAFSGEIDKSARRSMLLAGLFMGLSMISKHTAVFLWGGVGIYVLFFDRRWLKTKALYLAALISLVSLFPVLWWNIQNDFISFAFQGERVAVTQSGIRPDYFGTELLGEFFYNNPLNVIMIGMAVWAVFRKRAFMNRAHQRVLLASALPLIGVFIGFSLFRRTLPHWTAPAYLGLLPLAAAFLDEKYPADGLQIKIPSLLKYSLALLLLVLIVGMGHIKLGLADSLFAENQEDATTLGESDVSLDLVGWDQIKAPFAELVAKDQAAGWMSDSAVIVSRKWFPAAHLDYYVASPLNMKLLAICPVNEIHKYAWINKIRGGLPVGTDAYYLTTSIHYREPNDFYRHFFRTIEPAATLPIYRSGKLVKNVFVFRLKDYYRAPSYAIEIE